MDVLGTLETWFGPTWPAVWALAKIVAIIVPLMLCVAYLTLAERKVIGWMQVRRGPNRVTFFGIRWLGGWAQPIADGLKLLVKEIIVPTGANKFLFVLAPIMAIMPALAAWAVIPFGPELILSNIDAGLLYILAITSLGVYGIIIAGWSSNSRYAMLGAMRSAAQVVSYEIAMGFSLISVLILAGSLNLSDIVNAQVGRHGFLSWFAVPLLPMFIVYFVSGVAETNRAPFDVAEGESEIVAGFHVEYSGAPFAVFFLTEYANMILVSFLAPILFLGGWASPIQGWVTADVHWTVDWIWKGGWIWLFLKMFFFATAYIWFRASFPRYRYDQIMRLGWKVFIPITIVWVFVAGCFKYLGWFPLG